MRHIPFRRLPPGSASPGLVSESCEFDESAPGRQLVSCLMVTRGNLDFVRSACASFESQTWPDKELVVVTDRANDELRLLVRAQGEQVRLFEVGPGYTLGELRNLSVGRSRGDFVCPWDDDDLRDPDWIAASLRVLQQAAVDAVFLERIVLWWESRQWLALSARRAWEGSMLAKRSVIPVYPAMARTEDTAIVRWMLRYCSVALMDQPQFYVYRITGENTCDPAHFETLFAQCSRRYQAEEFGEVLRLPAFRFAGPRDPSVHPKDPTVRMEDPASRRRT